MSRIFKPFVIALMLAGLIVGGVAYAYSTFELPYRNRAYPGVKVMGTEVGGMNAQEIFALTTGKLQSAYNTPFITLKVLDRTSSYKLSELGVGANPAPIVEKALQFGREGTLADRIRIRTDVQQNSIDLNPAMFQDNEAVQRLVDRLALDIDKPSRDAAVIINGASVREVTAQTGVALEKEAAAKLIRDAINQGKPIELNLPTRPILPVITSAKEATEDAVRILKGEVAILLPKYNEQGAVIATTEVFRIKNADLLNYIYFEEAAPDKNGVIKLNVVLREEKLRPIIEPLAPAVYLEADDAHFMFDDKTSQLQVIRQDRPGRQLDVAATMKGVVEALRTGKNQVVLATQVTAAKLNTQVTASQLGIQKLLISASTNFAGSSSARVRNIQVAASRFHGVVIPPGGVFSYNEILGEVSTKDGFEEGLVILGDRTVKGVGGGVCQVSTTAYQAALKAGLPILERLPHGYRVGYYERGMGAGFDSTVFAPYVDLKFRNDTPGHILIESYVNTAGGTHTFKFYGTPDNREVSISKSNVLTTTPPGPDIYEPDPEKKVAENQVKQTEFAQSGATIVFSRQVKKDGKLVINENVMSKYVPWQNVFRYGPGFVPPPGVIVRDNTKPQQ